MRRFGLGLKNALRNPFRSAVLVICALLVAGFCFAVAVIDHGASVNLTAAEERYGADVVVFPEGAERETQGALLMGVPVQSWMPASKVAQVAAEPGVAAVSPQQYLGTIRDSPYAADSVLYLVALDPPTDFTLSPWAQDSLVSGLAGRQAIAGASVSTISENEPFVIYGYELALLGTLEPTGTSVDRTLFVTFETAADILLHTNLQTEQGFTIPADSVSSILVKVEAGLDPVQVAGAIQAAVPGVSPVTRPQLFGSLRDQMRGQRTVILVIFAVILALSLAVIVLVFSMVVNERRREIGVLRALGATQGRVLRSLLGSTAALALLGAVAGLVLSGLVLSLFRDSLENAFGFPFSLPSVGSSALFVILGLVVALGAVLAAAFIPARTVLVVKTQPYQCGSKEATVTRILAIILVILAIVIIVVPQFTNCAADGRSLTLENGKQVPMKCLWTARAELVTGIPLLVLGILMTVWPRRKDSTRSLSVVAVVLGVLTILLPTSLIGVCISADMDCNSILKPTMIVAGIVTILVALAALVLNERKTAQ